MAGLACGETSPLAWRFLQPAVDDFMTIADAEAIDAMRVLATGRDGDVPIVAGESGAAGLAGLAVLLKDRAQATRVGLDRDSRVLIVNTEGATAPDTYRELVGETADAVLARQAARAAGAPSRAATHV
jgi:diaminopropionate ammonia-lyase